MPDGSPGFRLAFEALVMLVATGFIAGVGLALRAGGEDASRMRRVVLAAGAALALWLAFTGRLAATGFLVFDPFPTMLPLLVGGLVIAFALAFSRLGGSLAMDLPLAFLVGYQGFRIPVELLLHRAHAEGLAPVQMTYLGMNFDILTGVTALLLAALSRLGPVPRWLLFGWNLVGFGLLVNVVTIAMLSAPMPLRIFWNEPANVWVTRFPWVWLPTFLVPLALLGHLLVWRRIFAQGAGAGTAGSRGT